MAMSCVAQTHAHTHKQMHRQMEKQAERNYIWSLKIYLFFATPPPHHRQVLKSMQDISVTTFRVGTFI